MKQDALIVNLFGGPSVGKSTTAAGVFALLKLHGVEVELVTEFAKDLVWEERTRTLGNQHYLFGKQYHRLWRVRDRVDVIVTDSPLMLSTVYVGPSSEVFTNYIVSMVNTFNNENIMLNRVKAYSNVGRYQNEAEARQLDIPIREALDDNDMDWVEVPGDTSGINSVVMMVLDKLGLPFRFRVESL